MRSEIDWRAKWAEADEYDEKRKERLAKQKGIAGEVGMASLGAYRECKENGLLGTRDEEGNFVWTVEQGAKAACFAREDAAATFLLQGSVLTRLKRIERLAVLAVGLLAYVAYRVS